MRPILAVLLLAAGFLPAALRAQTAPLSLDQNAFLYDTNYSPFGAALVPPGINWQSLSATIPNPSFETGNFSGWTTDAAGSSEAGVTTAGGSFANNGMIPQGVQVAWLQSFTAPVSISTTIANLIPGISYQVSFGANMRSGYGAPTAAWSLNGGPFVGFTASPAVGGSNPYYTITRSFTATGDTAALVIQNSNVSDSTLLVDDFTILQTPNQSQGFIALGAVTVAANVTLLNSNLNFFQNVTNLNWPRLSKPSGKVLAVLRAAQAGGPVSQGWLRVPGTVATWGNDRAGQLDVPAGLAGIVALAAGDTHSLALTNGGVVGWGSDSYGQLDVPAGLANVRQVAAGGNHSLALTAGGRVFGWGDMGGGQTTVPLGLTAVTFIAAGFDHSLAVANGFVVAWGNNAFGQTTVPAGLSNVIAVAGGQAHSLALLSDGTVVAWGNNQYGQTTVPGSITNGAAVGAGLNVVAIAAGYNHSLALLANGSVVAWGHNQYGQIKVPVSASNVVAISAGSGHSVALRTDGTLVAWGNPAYAQTTFVSQLGRLTAIAAGGIHTLALVGNGQPMLEQQPITQAVPAGGTAVFAALAAGAPPLTYQWYSMGGLMSGQSSSVLTRAGLSQADAGSYSVVVGNALGSTTSAIATLTVESIPTLTPIVLAGQHVTQGASSGAYNAPAGTSLALSVVAAGTPPFTYQWYTNLTALVDNQHLSGSASTNLIIQALTANDSGLYSVVVNNEFGTAVQTVALNVFQPTVLQTVGKTDVTVTSGGSAQWSVQASGDGTFTYQWTFNGTNQPNETGSTLTRNDVSYTNAGIYKVTVTDSYGVSEQSSFFLSLLVGWGDDSSGQTDVPGNLLGVTSVAAGDAHSLAAQIDGTVAAWGADDYGQIEVPMSLTNISSVAAGGNHSLALSGGGQVFAWGDDDSGQSDVPAALTNGTTGVLMIAAGFNHSLAVTTNNAPYAWGDNTYSQTHIPPGLLGVTALAGGVRHTLALGTNGTVTAWGDSTYGQANVPLAITTNMPAESRMPVVAIAAGYYHSLALLTNGTVLAWGNNQFGQTNVPAGLTNVIAIAAGSGLSLALCSTGSVVAWGNPAETQPQFVSGLETVRYLASGGFHNLALVSGGRPPEFQVAPTNRVVLPGDNITLISEAIGTAPLSYQWYFTPNTPPGSTNTMLANTTPTNSLPMIANGNFGVYQIVCSNSFGAVTNSATLSAAIIDPQPTNQTIIQGQPVSFSIAVANVAGLGYHWYFNGIEAAGRGTLLGGGQATYSIPAVSDLNAGYYSVVVTNTAGGSLTSSAAQLTVLVPPSMVNFNPGSLTTNLNSPLTLTAQFTASSNNLSAQWVVNGQAAAGTANQVSYQAPAPPSTLGRYSNYLTISSCQNVNAGQYCLVIGNAAATTTNTGPALSVASGGVVYFPPYVSGQPQSLSTNSGSRVVLSVAAASGAGYPLSYQWYKDGGVITGLAADLTGRLSSVAATSATLDLGYVTTSAAGSYSVGVSDGSITTLSDAAVLGVTKVSTQAGQAIPQPLAADLALAPVGGPPVVPQGAAVWNADNSKLYASGTYAAAAVTWLDAANNSFIEEVSISNPAATNVVLGQKVPVPFWADATRIPAGGPRVDTLGDPRTILLWHPASNYLYATAAGAANVYWPVEGQASTALTVPQLVQTSWPDPSQFQTYIANSAPVNLATGSNGLVVTTLMDQDPGLGVDPAQVANRNLFQATNSGRALLLLAPAQPSAATNIYFQFVNSVQWTNAAPQTTTCVIGRTLTSFPDHNPGFGAPYVLNPVSPYCAAPGYLNRASRTGPIIPVNRNSASSDHDLVLVYYQAGANLFNPATGTPLTGNPIGWPSLPVRFDCQWPTASQVAVGGSVAPSSVIPNCVSWQLYVQNDPTLPGFNPNDEHALTLGDRIAPLRNDLGTAITSLPYLLVSYQDRSGTNGIAVWQVVGPKTLAVTATAGQPLTAPYPLNELPASSSTYFSGGTNHIWQGRTGAFYAMAGPDDGGTGTTDLVLNYYYPVQSGFYFPSNWFSGAVQTNLPPAGTQIPWLGLTMPTNYTYAVSWPANAGQLQIGQTLVVPPAGSGLPFIDNPTAPTASVEILYQQSLANGGTNSVMLFDPTLRRAVPLAKLPAKMAFSPNGGLYYFPSLPPALRARVSYNPVSGLLNYVGQYVQTNPEGTALAYPYLLLDVLSPIRDVPPLLALSSDPNWTTAVNQLSNECASAAQLVPDVPFNHPAALTTGAGGGTGYVTLAFGYSTNLALDQPGDLITLAVIQVTNSLYAGQIEVIKSANPFDQNITLRHSSDFGGLADSYRFAWKYASVPKDGSIPASPDQTPGAWLDYTNYSTPVGALEITIGGPGLLTLDDHYFACRYQSVNPNSPSGANRSTWTAATFVPGWLTRVLEGTDPLDPQVSSYYEATANNTIVSMIALAGEPFRGLVPLDGAAAVNLGLIELYTTVFSVAQGLSIAAASPVTTAGDPNLGPELLATAGSLSDLYMLLGNEAYAEACDPTVTIPASANIPAVAAASIHVFEGQTATRLEEELILLRGRDDSYQPAVTNFPYYNRLPWNFTGLGANNSGQVAYANEFGVFTLADAEAQYPMGHGDAWGHYLSAVSYYYELLQNTNFTWVPQVQSLPLDGSDITVQVNYEHEQKFASAAAARAKTGADIVNLTYRSAYVEDPTGQWQGYLDTHPNRAWGVSEWGSRAGQAALFDWVVANALLPPVSTNAGIGKIDRTTVTALGDIAASYTQVQSEVDKGDAGLSPLGLAKNVMPFDIEPSQGSGTHFEQIYARAVVAVNNALALFNLASGARQALLAQADTLTSFNNSVQNQEAGYNNQLIQSFGYPYGDDIGAGGAYPQGYTGPDLYHYMYYDPTQILGVVPPNTVTFVATNADVEVDAQGALYTNLVPVTYNFATNNYGLVKPAIWTQPRQAPGAVQLAQSDLLQATAAFNGAVLGYENLIQQIEDQANLLQAQYNVNASIITILDAGQNTMQTLDTAISANQARQLRFQESAQYATQVAEALANGLPTVTGFVAGFADGVTFDPSFFARQVIQMAGTGFSDYFTAEANNASLAQLDEQQAQALAQNADSIQVTALNQSQSVSQQLAQLQELVRTEATSRLQLYQLQEALLQSEGKYNAAIAAGWQIWADRLRFRQQTAAQVQEYRYKDMAYRTFQTDALQKYRATFDLAATYVYLAAAAYDYDTALGPNDPDGPGSEFMTAIVRARSIGQVSNGQPIAGSSANGDDPGLADPMARMYENYQYLKGSLGLNNPDPATIQFSLRSENFRITAGAGGRTNWQNQLAASVVPNILAIPEFQRYCIPPSPLQSVEPGIVISFSTTVGFGQNFFGWPLAGGDNSYDSSHFATKISSEGVWFDNYNGTALQETPSVYLIPVGIDFLRTPGGDGATRQWKIAEQRLPVPFPAASTSVSATNWIPINATLGNQFYAIRRYPALQAYNDGGFNQSQVTSSSRLVGRSVWNTKWMLVIPAGALLGDRNEAIQRFIYGALLDPNGPASGPRDGNGVSDIKISFQTLSYPGY